MSAREEIRSDLLRLGRSPEQAEKDVAETMAKVAAIRDKIRAKVLTEAADVAEMVGSGFFDNAHSGEGNGAMAVAAELRDRAAILTPAAPDDEQPTRAQTSADKLRRLFDGGCMPAAAYQGTRGEPGDGA